MDNFKKLLEKILGETDDRRKHPRKKGDVWKHTDPVHGGRRPNPVKTH